MSTTETLNQAVAADLPATSVDQPADVDHARVLTRAFVRDYLEAVEAQIDAEPDPRTAYAGSLFAEAMAKAADLGLTTASIPEQWGGSGWSATAQLMMVEELAQGAPGLSSHIMSGSLAAGLIISTGAWRTNDIYRAYLDGVATHERARQGACWAATEPAVGSDIFTLATPGVSYATRAVRTPEGYRLSGEKSSFPSNGYCADFFVVMAAIEDAEDMSTAAVFLVPGDTPGIERGEPVSKLGMRALNQAQVRFVDVHLPPEAMIVPPGPAYDRWLHRLTARGNTAVGLQSLGLAQRAYDLALAHVKRRQQGGRRLIEHQLVAEKMFTAYREIQAARALCYQAVAAIERGRLDVLTCYASRVQASTMAVRVVEQMTQAMGGYGIDKNNPMERYYRDVKLMTIADGTVEKISLVGAGLL